MNFSSALVYAISENIGTPDTWIFFIATMPMIEAAAYDDFTTTTTAILIEYQQVEHLRNTRHDLVICLFSGRMSELLLHQRISISAIMFFFFDMHYGVTFYCRNSNGLKSFEKVWKE